jgi:hypothetical protein
MASFWTLISLIKQLVDGIAMLLGYIRKVQHDNKIEEIRNAVEVIVAPETSEERRREATKSLEDSFNRRV